MNTPKFHLRLTLPVFSYLLTCLLLCVGCVKNTGPTRYELSGKVTYDGKPVPAGTISFAPDESKGNKGPGTTADIKDGAYCTRRNDGTIGGPHVVTLNGFDGCKFTNKGIVNPVGKPIFVNIQISIDLPNQTCTHDFAIPAKR